LKVLTQETSETIAAITNVATNWNPLAEAVLSEKETRLADSEAVLQKYAHFAQVCEHEFQIQRSHVEVLAQNTGQTAARLIDQSFLDLRSISEVCHSIDALESQLNSFGSQLQSMQNSFQNKLLMAERKLNELEGRFQVAGTDIAWVLHEIELSLAQLTSKPNANDYAHRPEILGLASVHEAARMEKLGSLLTTARELWKTSLTAVTGHEFQTFSNVDVPPT
jgi:hypothetical protein